MLWIGIVLCAILGNVLATPLPENEVIEHFTDNYIEEVAGLFEGDINEDLEKRAAVSHIWPNGKIYYTIDSKKTAAQHAIYESAMREIEDDTKSNGKYCVQFIPRTAEHGYLKIEADSGCHSHVGHTGSSQVVSLSSGCDRKGTVMHEFLHALGFWHEQSRHDRDNYITILWNNIRSGGTVHTRTIPYYHWRIAREAFSHRQVMETVTVNQAKNYHRGFGPTYVIQSNQARHSHNFNVHSGNTLGSQYDFGSIMHYNAYEFATDKSTPTITTKVPGHYIGQRFGLSVIDVEKIQLLYNCPVDTTHVQDIAALHPIINCHFETDLCGMVSDVTGGVAWTRYQGPTPTSGTGPKADHTSGDGHYLYAEASGNHGKIARLITPQSIPTGTYCVDIQLYLWDDATGHLKVKYEHLGSEHTLKEYRDHYKDGWHNLRLSITMHHDFKLIIEADLGTSDKSDIAMDDLLIYPGHCR